MTEVAKGAKCSQKGKEYELQCFAVVKHCSIDQQPFTLQTEESLGGCSNDIDLQCQYQGTLVGIEIKKAAAPDWVQCKLQYNEETKQWSPNISNRSKIPKQAAALFEERLRNVTLFDGLVPPFVEKKVTHEEWVQIKKESLSFRDVYIDCPSDTIRKLYGAKGCHYIQISGKGLYHLDKDPCGFQVPEFVCPQQFRIRTKIHTRKNKDGYCDLSVMMACQPKKSELKQVENSPYSLDKVDRLPPTLLYCNQVSS